MDWRSKAPEFFFQSRNDFATMRSPEPGLAENARRILSGQVQFFQGEWKTTSADEWLLNTETGYRYDNRKHWTDIPDFHPVFGDIKYVWERSRFSFLQTILRHDAHTGADSSGWVFRQLDSWLEHNPVNCGPNYRCSQEISLRIFNWTLALYFYRDAAALTEERFQRIIFSIYWQLRHVRSNIDFSRIAVRNNHAITETLALYTAGLIFPFFEEAQEWKNSGKKWFEQEIAYQIYEDGTYLQFSNNYHRAVLQLLTWATGLARRHHDNFDSVVYDRAYASLQVLLAAQDAASGQLPNYGSNDGSLFFRWNDSNFRDFRPSLDALHFALTGRNLYPEPYEDRTWFGLRGDSNKYEPLAQHDGTFSFPNGGIYIYRHKDLMAWINCTSYKDRPHQADCLHLDVWYKGENLLCDAGSYRYNTSPDKMKYFFGTESHNTVMVDEEDQMLKGPRFVWLYWTKAAAAGWTTEGNRLIFEGRASVFGQLGGLTHFRKVTIDADQLKFVVTDRLVGANGRTIRQLWHLEAGKKNRLVFEATPGSGKLVRKELMKSVSPTYGVLQDSLQIEFQTTSDTLTTQITLA